MQFNLNCNFDAYEPLYRLCLEVNSVTTDFIFLRLELAGISSKINIL